MDKGHCTADFWLKETLNVGYLMPLAGLEINEPEIIEHGLFWSGATVNEDMPG